MQNGLLHMSETTHTHTQSFAHSHKAPAIVFTTVAEEQAAWMAKKRRQGPILTRRTKHYIRVTLPRLATTQTFTYLYDNRRAQSSMWQQERGAAQCRAVPADRVIRDVICSKESKGETGKRKEDGETRVFICRTIWSWMDWQWSCQQQSADKSLLLGKISLEEILMLNSPWNTGNSVIQKVLTAFTIAVGECKCNIIADVARFGWITVFLSNV